MGDKSSTPIIFSGAMVRAILEGRKTQTRRVVAGYEIHGPNRPNKSVFDVLKGTKWCGAFGLDGCGNATSLCPYGKPGDRLWVRETFALYGMEALPDKDRPVFFRGDDDKKEGWATPLGIKRKPAIHMPRWASRITLEIVNVRVQRVQDISEEDAKAEGVVPKESPIPGNSFTSPHRASFNGLWDVINAKRDFGWEINPWVWVIEFKRLRCQSVNLHNGEGGQP